MGGNQLAICNGGRGFELGTTEKKSRKWPEQGLKPEPPDCDSMHSPLGQAASYHRLLLNTQQRNDTNVTWHCRSLHYDTLHYKH